MNANGIKSPYTDLCVSLYGLKLSLPGVVAPNDCGTEYSDAAVLYPARISEEQFSELQDAHYRASVLNPIAYAQDCKDVEKTVVFESFEAVFPLDKARQTPWVYESCLDDDYWNPRILMLQTAYRCRSIFTVSVVPTNPDIRQTLYQKHILQPAPAWFDPNLSYVPEFIVRVIYDNHSETVTESKNESKKLTGFLKPFDTYNCSVYTPDPIFNTIQAVVLESCNDLPACVKSITALSAVLLYFLADQESQSIGITCLLSGRPFALLFTKPSISSDGRQKTS